MEDDKFRAFLCPWCQKVANGIIRGVAVWDGYGLDGQPEEPPAEWSLLQCDNCRLASVQVRCDYSGPNGFGDDEPTVVFPQKRRAALAYEVPKSIRSQWEEASQCFDAKAYTAAVVMVRRALEATCAEHGVKERTLAASLRSLKEKDLINGTLVEWADALRVLGNEGAHYTGKAVNREDAEDALAFADALIDYMYVLRLRFDQFKHRRAQSGTGR